MLLISPCFMPIFYACPSFRVMSARASAAAHMEPRMPVTKRARNHERGSYASAARQARRLRLVAYAARRGRLRLARGESMAEPRWYEILKALDKRTSQVETKVRGDSGAEEGALATRVSTPRRLRVF